MNSIGAMSSPVKQSLPTVLAPPNISNSSPSKVQQPPNLTPLNLNTSSQSAQPLSLVNENKNAPIVIPPPVITSVENVVQKPATCNGVPETKLIGVKIEETGHKIEQQVPHNQVNNSVTVKNIIESPPSEVKSQQVSEIENLSQKKDEKMLAISKEDKVVTEKIEKTENEPIKPVEPCQTEILPKKCTENDTQVVQEPTESKTVVQTNQEQTASSEKIEQATQNTSKGAVRRKREHKVSFNY